VKDRLRAFSLTEVLLSLVLLVVLGFMVAIVLGTSARSNHQSGGFLVARTLVSSKLSQLQAAGYTALNGPGLGQSGAGIVDGTPTTPTPQDNAQGAISASFTFTQTNQITQYFPTAGGGAAPQGRIFIAPYLPAKRTTAGVDSYPLVRATVEVQWSDSNGLPHTYSETTLIPQGAL
jgi:type II secretory pathway pseudopilin PulG